MIPSHVAIIMDGNGRWARGRHLRRILGHRRGLERAEEVVKNAKELGIKIVTLFAFSTENWSRPRSEVAVLFSYLKDYLIKNKDKFNEQGIRINFIGRRDRFTKSLLKEMEAVEELTRHNSTLLVNIALDYGGKWDILNAATKLAGDIVKGQKMIHEINEQTFGQHLALANISPPDLLIRTSGEYRISNFILWDIAYSELYFTSCLWPDFDKHELKKAVDEYARRERRFGKVISH